MIAIVLVIFHVVVIIFAIFGLFALVPMVLLIQQCDRRGRERPIDEILKDARAQGKITLAQYEHMIDEVHRSMPDLDRPYPRVKERL